MKKYLPIILGSMILIAIVLISIFIHQKSIVKAPDIVSQPTIVAPVPTPLPTLSPEKTFPDMPNNPS